MYIIYYPGFNLAKVQQHLADRIIGKRAKHLLHP